MISPLYRDSSAAVDDRVDDLLGRMNLDEKLAQLGCIWSAELVTDDRFDVERAAERMRHGMGQITRIGASTGLHPGESARLMNQIQRVAVEQTRLGIPIVVHEEAVGGLCQRDATVFPQALGLSATWDPSLVEEVADVIRSQMRAVGARLALSPVLDVARDPRWGRVEETYGEDPFLDGAMGTAYVRGLQTPDLRNGVAATGKHFLGYGMSEGGRNWNPVHVGPRELRDVYAEPFAAAIRDGGLAAVMNSYASVDGLPCAGSGAILTDLLRGELGFDGAVVADYWAVTQLVDFHRVALDRGDAARLSLGAGLDMELPEIQCYGAPLRGEIEAGRVPMAVVDTAVRRVLRLKFRLGLFEQPYVDEQAADPVFDTPAHRALARRAASESIVLLANDGVLPLSPSVARLAVIGPGADDRRILQGDYHYPAHQEPVYLKPQGEAIAELVPQERSAFTPGPYFTHHVTPRMGITSALDGRVAVRYARGCDLMGGDRSGFDEAVDAARDADVVVAVLAGKSGIARPVTSGEANDATNLDLPEVQCALVDALAEAGRPLVVVVISGRVHTLERVAKHANALLMLFPPGEEGGNGLADVLTGAAGPSGRLPVSLPRSVGQVPVYAGHRAGGDRVEFFGDYIDSPASPLFAFGHGLSYTTFAYDGLHVSAADIREPVIVRIEICNTGSRAGTDVVQLYCRDDVASVARPDRILVGFTRVHLEPEERRTVSFRVHPSRLAFYDAAMRFVTEPGTYTFSVGASSADIRAEGQIQLNGGVATYVQREIVATEVVVD